MRVRLLLLQDLGKAGRPLSVFLLKEVRCQPGRNAIRDDVAELVQCRWTWAWQELNIAQLGAVNLTSSDLLKELERHD